MDDKLPTVRKTILIAEDEALILKMLAHHLKKEGYTVMTAIDGREALASLRTFTPDLVITDLMMPYHDGLEILEYVKKSMNIQIPVIILSATGNESTMEKALRLGADDYVDKPFTPNGLLSRIKKHLG